MTFENISKDNISALTQMTIELWPDENYEEEFSNCTRILHSDKEICFLARKDGRYAGFIYLSIREEYVEGAFEYPVGYIEGIYVKQAYRKQAIARRLVEMGEQWSKTKGCKSFASDAELHNESSIRFHKRIGFEESSRIVTFVKHFS